MEIVANVFSSKITRSQNQQQSNLYALLNKSPAKPVELSNTKDDAYNFRHKTEKYYTSQNKSRLKVKTVGDIRKLFEQEISSYLPNDIENQQNMLLRKIREGSSNDENTRKIAKDIVNADKPISRSTWAMLSNINPERHTYNKQFVIWNGSYIQVNGSKGGENKFICCYDLHNIKLHNIITNRRKTLNKRNALLNNSLSLKFKPGPLGRKKYLDDSYQKYHVGKIELVNLPKVGLDVYPSYGVALEPNVTKFINNLRNSNGVVSEKWAEFAVSVLGTVKNSSIIQVDTNSCISFDLAYKCEQKRILTRRDIDNALDTVSVQNEQTIKKYRDAIETMPEIESIVHELVDSVEINLKQDNMYSNAEGPRDIIQEYPINTINCKDKAKRKYCELDRLDVTVIQLPENSSIYEEKICQKEYCTLGCVCASLEYTQNVKNHCGLIECMFNCKCDFLKYKNYNSLQNQYSELIPGLLNIDTDINLKLAKEEKKFHQTVVVSGEKRILLKSHKRNWKASRKYGDFYKNVNLKAPVESKRILSIVALKLDTENIVPWCMIHKLYKCFCKGKFKDTSICETNDNNIISKPVIINKEKCNTDIILDENKNNDVPVLRTRYERKNSIKLYQNNSIIIEKKSINSSECGYRNYCARIKPYKKRKYNNNYYKETNNKILEMEKNDKNLLKRMKTILLNAELNSVYDSTNKITDKEPEDSVDIITNKSVDKVNFNMTVNSVLNKTNLATWLEASYKLYKRRIERGKLIVNAPKPGKLALYPWNFILKRYRERKNLFLVTKHKPYRIFMAISTEDEVLNDCFFIDEIRFTDLHKFPTTVRNLLTNVTNLENIFYIMYGFKNSWELIGSVTKLSEPPDTKITEEVPNVVRTYPSPTPSMSIKDTLISKSLCEMQPNESIDKFLRKNTDFTCVSKNSETSKWFVMNVENDFNEIQFYNRGFFVKFESILKAISVARKTGKTVRLSTQTCASNSSCPQFGIYAIPDSKGHYVFVGPYEINEPLGIETVKTILDVRKHRRTRGVWITTNKLDNMNVIDNPLSFMPPQNIDYNAMVPIDADEIKLSKCIEKNKETLKPSSLTKTIKPITIRKTNGFYHLASNGVLKKIPLQSPQKIDQPIQKNNDIENQNAVSLNTSDPKLNDLAFDCDNANKKEFNSSTSSVCSSSKVNTEDDKRKGGMLILKPDEINKRMLDAKVTGSDLDEFNIQSRKNKIASNDSIIDIDIENFLYTAFLCKDGEYSTFVISDDSESNTDEDFTCDRNEWNVWIQCTNINNFGWIKGKNKANNLLSFEFPGFKPSEFYHEEEAFNKINQVLARKIYIPKHLSLKWEVIDSANKLRNKEMLDVGQLNSDFVLTNEGIQRIIKSVKSTSPHSNNKLKTNLRNQYSSEDSTNGIDQIISTSTNECSLILQDLEETSVHLENEGLMLFNEAVANKSSILTTLNSAPDDVKQEMTDTLINIKMMADE